MVFETPPPDEFLQGVYRFANETPAISFVTSAGGALHHWDHARDAKADGYIANHRINENIRALRGPKCAVATTHVIRGMHAVTPDGEAIGRLMADYFFAAGFRNMGLLVRGGLFCEELRRGYEQVLRQHGIRPHIVPLTGISIYKEWDKYREWVRQWLAAIPKPAAVLCYSDFRAVGVLKVCEQDGVSVPDEVALAGIDNTTGRSPLLPVPLTSVDINDELCGYEAMRLLYRIMRNPNLSPQVVRVPPRGIVERMSTNVLHVPDAAVGQAVRYIRDHLQEGINIADVQQQVHIGRRMLELRFKKTLGRTPHEELIRVRISRARDLLSTTALTINEVADRCGFSEVRALCVRFKAETGLTPGEFRARQHNEPYRRRRA